MKLESALLLVFLVAVVGCLVGSAGMAIFQGSDCDKVAERVGYANYLTRDAGEFCEIYIGDDPMDGHEVWVSTKK